MVPADKKVSGSLVWVWALNLRSSGLERSLSFSRRNGGTSSHYCTKVRLERQRLSHWLTPTFSARCLSESATTVPPHATTSPLTKTEKVSIHSLVRARNTVESRSRPKPHEACRSPAHSADASRYADTTRERAQTNKTPQKDLFLSSPIRMSPRLVHVRSGAAPPPPPARGPVGDPLLAELDPPLSFGRDVPGRPVSRDAEVR